MLRILIAAGIVTLALLSNPALAGTPSNNGQYHTLAQSFACPKDTQQYGDFYVWGYWEGGWWCGQQMPEGYYVLSKGIWYVWNGWNW
jgi:hypothetical protein